MPLQNRVTPFGDIIAVPDRGLFTGNRGIIHDPVTRTIKRRWSSKAWLVCLCEFKGKRRQVMSPGTWTELFFLDEATALAAGHRPCFFCRRQAAKAFQASWAAGNGGIPPLASAMDAILHAERLSGRTRRLHAIDRPLSDFPNGTMVARGPESFVLADGGVWRWRSSGYVALSKPPECTALLTPPSTLRALQAGYRPLLHPTALAGLSSGLAR